MVRLKLCFDIDNEKLHEEYGRDGAIWVNDFPYVPRADEMFYLREIIEAENAQIELCVRGESKTISITNELYKEIANFFWHIEMVAWHKDKQGYYVKIFLTGE